MTGQHRSVSVSIVIATRNRASALSRCLNSLLQQSYKPQYYEIIVVDDGSTDETYERVIQIREKLCQGGQVQLHYIPQSGLGANAARNRGIHEAKGKIIVFVDDDITAPPHWLGALMEGLFKSDAEVVTGPVRLAVDGAILGKHREEVRSLLAEVLTPPRGIHGQIVPVVGNMAAYYSVFQRALFDETVRPPVEEIDWLLKVKANVAFVPEAWVWHHKSPGELRLSRILWLAWSRGSESGWWIRERLKVPFTKRLMLAARIVKTVVRAVGHALIYRCWGGVVVGLSELSKGLALVGLTNRGKRVSQSWR